MEILTKKLKEHNIVDSINPVKGCSREQIGFIEKSLSISLPESYKKFLELFGQGMGKLFQGTDFEFKDLIDLQDDEIIGELRSDAGLDESQLNEIFVFMVHQGYITYFFYCNEGDNPKVFRFREGGNKAEEIAKSFSEFLNLAIDDFIAQDKKIW